MTPATTNVENSPRKSIINKINVLTFLLDNLVWLILLIVLVACSLTIDKFFQAPIFVNILRQATFVGIISVGLSLTIITGRMDLSVESVLGIGAMSAAYILGSSGSGLGLELNTWLVLLLVLAIGASVGLFNGVLIVKLGINAFIVTLGTFILVRGLTVAISGGTSVFGLPDDMRAIAKLEPLGIPVLVILLVLTYIIFGFVLGRTKFGRYLYLIGGNENAPFRAGIPIKRILIITFMVSGALAAFGGFLLAARTNGATANLGIGLLFEAFAAVVIGGVSLSGGVGKLSGVFAGVILLSTIDTAINIMGIPPHYMQVVRGTLVLIAVILDSVKSVIRKKYLH
jgi:ribose transport system permease protein